MNQLDLIDGLWPLKTPLIPLDGFRFKLESCQPMATIKVRTAIEMIRAALASGEIDEATKTLVASSSGGFACAASVLAKVLRLRFIAVIDRLTPPGYQKMLSKTASETRVCNDLRERLATVDALSRAPDTVVLDQYKDRNVLVAQQRLGAEIFEQYPSVRAIYSAVSTGGTILGVAQVLKRHRPDVQVVAVDVEGSKAFYDDPRPRVVSGAGSSVLLPFLKEALEENLIDDVVQVSTEDTMQGCADLLSRGVSLGSSSGAVYKAMMFQNLNHAVGILADGGAAYA